MLRHECRSGFLDKSRYVLQPHVAPESDPAQFRSTYADPYSAGNAKLAAMTVAGSVGSGRATSATVSSYPSLRLARGPFGKK